jgi:sugar-specific transcriptional regulator TrmB
MQKYWQSMLLESQLTKFGLSDKEAPTYIALLDLGTCTVSEVSKKQTLTAVPVTFFWNVLRKKALSAQQI